ncbi:MAG: gliding motility-associated C-terminal domain-containing protein, partial [Saprospiraceae bacterium]
TRVIGLPNGTLAFAWSDEACINCQFRTIEAFESISYEVVVTDENGCVATDDIRITVFIDRALYIPTVFSPNGDQVNDEFLISSGPFVDVIEEILIYDRWGNLVFQKNNFLPNDPTSSWDGTMKNRLLNPGVFTYMLAVKFKDGFRESRAGTITILM